MDGFHEILQRFWSELMARPDGPLALRFVIQPVVSSMLAIRDGLKDAHGGRSPYFWALLTDRERRGARLREGAKATGKIMILALVLDVVYQYVALSAFRPVEALVIAFVLGFVPYILIRGPIARVVGRRRSTPTVRD